MESDSSVNASSQKWTACQTYFYQRTHVACTIESRSVEYFHFLSLAKDSLYYGREQSVKLLDVD